MVIKIDKHRRMQGGLFQQGGEIREAILSDDVSFIGANQRNDFVFAARDGKMVRPETGPAFGKAVRCFQCMGGAGGDFTKKVLPLSFAEFSLFLLAESATLLRTFAAMFCRGIRTSFKG